MRNALCALRGLLLITCAASAQSFDLARQNDDAAAGVAFARWAQELGYKVEDIKGNGDVIEITLDNGFRAYVQVTANTDGIDRIVLDVGFKSHGGAPSLADKRELANRINLELLSCKVTVDSDGDFVYQFALVFDDQLPPALFRKFIKHAVSSIHMIREKYSKDFERFSR